MSPGERLAMTLRQIIYFLDPNPTALRLEVKSNLLLNQFTYYRRCVIIYRCLVAGDSMRSISYQYILVPNTVSKFFLEVCKVLWLVLMSNVFTPLTKEAWRTWATEYDAKADFPRCLAAIDGKHCVVQALPGTGSQFYNYKGSYSVVLLAAVSAQYRFIMVDIGTEERSSDRDILKNSAFGRALARNELDFPPPEPISDSTELFPYVFVADEAFPLTTNMMRPALASNDCRKYIWDFICKVAHLPTAHSGSLPLVRAIIKVTTCLRNWLLTEEENLQPEERKYCSSRTPDSVDQDGNIIEGQWRTEVSDDNALRDLPPAMRLGSNRYSEAAANIREEYTDFFLSRGQIERQWRKIPVRC
ncbi:hypothetical protein PR048_023843 [Dryococelus australis]|uniref:DDE Tnp4 domain-containing protein n=1 Tax=Dryococelus australis TaxID=614101 RepID=A0ABQ9GV65_9NEOP|nr:hypothetical protein PR048_023843 [Dryococelus australis]